MKKFNLVLVFVASILLQYCTGNKKPGTTIVVSDTARVIDTTIFEDGVAPIASNERSAKADKQKKEKVSCGFNFKKFNNRKRPIEEAPGGVKGKKPKPPKPPTDDPPPPPPPPPPTSETNVIYLNFYGKTVENTMWGATFTVGDAGLGQPEIDYIMNHVKTHYQNHNVIVTNDENIFNAAAEGHKIEILITESWEWFGQAGGVAYINSYFWTDATPAFVFSLLLNYNAHYIAEATAHEAGHTLGLRHQSDCESGVVVNQYRNGWMMGVGYYVPLGMKGIGTSSMMCATQDDILMLTSALGLK